jgi:hypothetical protein
MLSRVLGQHCSIGMKHGPSRNEDRSDSGPRHRHKGSLQIGGAAHLATVETHAEAPRRLLRLLYVTPMALIAGIYQKADPRSTWKSFFHELEPFRSDVGRLGSHPGNVAPRLGKRGNKSTPDRIVDDRNHNRDRPGRLVRRLTGKGVGGHDDLNLGSYYVRSEVRELLGPAPTPPVNRY